MNAALMSMRDFRMVVYSRSTDVLSDCGKIVQLIYKIITVLLEQLDMFPQVHVCVLGLCVLILKNLQRLHAVATQ